MGYGGQGYGNQHQQPDYGSQQQPGYGSKVYGTPHGPGASLPAEVQHQQQPLAMHRLDRGFFDNATPVAKGPAFVDLREVYIIYY
jgi:hypothetical protein